MDKSIENLTGMLADMVFVYINKDEVFPHGFELNTMKNVCSYLKENYDGNKYSADFFNVIESQLDLIGKVDGNNA